MSSKYEAAFLADQVRSEFGIDNRSSVDIFNLARQIPHLTTVFYPLGENISGICVKQKNFSIISVNSEQSYGRQRFTMAHELYHLYYDKSSDTSICLSDSSKYNKVEREADSFASYLLLPYHALQSEIKEYGLNKERDALSDDDLLKAVVAIEQRYMISRKALLVRLADVDIITKEQREDLGRNVIKNARRLGYPSALYEPRRGIYMKQVEGEYVDLIVQLYSNDLISQGKAEELLADGFRDDIKVLSLTGEELVD